MSQPRDRRIVSAVEGNILHGSQGSTSSPPRVTLEPITSFKRSLEEIGFDTGPGDELVQVPTPTSTLTSSVSSNSTRNNIPVVVADRGYSGTPDIIAVPEPMQSTFSMSQQIPSRSLGAAARSMLARRRPSVATPPLLPPINSQQSHLLELISDFSPEPENQSMPLDTPESSSTSENEVFLATTRRPDPLRLPLNQVRQQAANATPTTPSSWSSSTTTPSTTPLTRRLFHNSSLQRAPATAGSSRTVGGIVASSAGPSQPRFSFEESVSNQRSPELPPIDTSDNGLGGLSSLLYDSPAPSTTFSDAPLLQASSGSNNATNSRTHTVNPYTSNSRSFLLARPFVESPSPPINVPQTATITSTMGESWAERAARFDEAIAPLRQTPPPPRHQAPPRLDIHTRYRVPYLPHPFEEIMSPTTPGEPDDNASEFSWEDQRDAYRYIRDLNTVIDEREAESGELTPVLTIPMLPPIVPSPLLVVDSGLNFEDDIQNPTSGARVFSEEETEWEADEVPSAWLREARRHLGRPVTSSTSREAGAPPPLLELPNFSSTSLGLVDFPNSASSGTPNPGTHPEAGAPQVTAAPPRNPNINVAPSREILRRLSTEHLRQLRRVAIRSVASRSRSRSSMAPSVISSDGDASRVSDVRPESVVSNEDIVVGVPPVLDEPFDRSVWRELEGRMQQAHHHHGHFRPMAAATTDAPRSLPAIDVRRQPRISLGPLSSGLHFDGEVMGAQETISNVSVRPAVPSASSETTANGEQTNSELGEWRELVEGSLSSQAVPVLAFSSPSAAHDVRARPWVGGNAHTHWRMRRLEQFRSASSMGGDGGNTRYTSQSLRQTVNDYREGRLSEAQLENSLGVAMLEMRAEMESAGSFRSPSSASMNGELHQRAAADLVSLSSPQPVRRTAEAEAFQLLDSVWSNSNSATVQGMSREMEFMERSLLERSVDVVPRRTHSPLWDTDDPLSEFLSDVGFDGSYEALMELSEQLGVVPRGLSDAAFGALRTTFFKDLEPGLGPLSPTLSTVSQSDNGTGDLSASVSPTLASFSSPRIRRARTGKWIAQCSICLEEYGSEDICVTLDCTHFFHQSCVRQWFHSASTCPLCRHPLPRN